MKAMHCLFGLCALLSTLCWAQSASTPGDYASVWKCNESKFNWYCDEENQPKKALKQEALTPHEQRLEVKQIHTAKQWRDEIQRRLDVMTMKPNDKNVIDFLEIWLPTQAKGSLLADTWRRVVWQNPQFDYTLRRPVNNSAIRTHDEIRDNSAVMHLSKLAKEHGLMFFFRSDCPYCHKMAPTLKQFGQRYGIEILPVSLDGKGLPDFPSPKINRGHAKALGVGRVPALFIASRKTKEIAPIGFGVMSQAEIIDRIFVLTNTQPGETF